MWFDSFYCLTLLKECCIHIFSLRSTGKLYFVFLQDVSYSKIECEKYFWLWIQYGLFYFRSDRSIREHLPEDCAKRRKRRTNIGIQTSIIALLVELVGNLTIILLYNFSQNGTFKPQLMVCTVISIYFVLIPGSCLLATNKVREHIFDQGWCNGFSFPTHTAEVAPLPNIAIELDGINWQWSRRPADVFPFLNVSEKGFW